MFPDTWLPTWTSTTALQAPVAATVDSIVPLCSCVNWNFGASGRLANLHASTAATARIPTKAAPHRIETFSGSAGVDSISGTDQLSRSLSTGLGSSAVTETSLIAMTSRPHRW